MQGGKGSRCGLNLADDVALLGWARSADVEPEEPKSTTLREALVGKDLSIRQAFDMFDEDYDGPKRPNGGFLENLKITVFFFVIFRTLRKICGKITEHLRKTTEIMQTLQKNKNSVISRIFFSFFLLIFQVFENCKGSAIAADP